MKETIASGEHSVSSGNEENQDKQAEHLAIEAQKVEKPSYESYQKVLSEKKKAVQELKLYKEKEAAELQRKLEESGNYKKVLEERDRKIQELEQERENTKKELQDMLKLSYFKKMLPGPLDESFLPLVNLDEIPVDENGHPDKLGVERYSKEWLKTYSRVIPAQSTAKLPQGGAVPTSRESITEQEWKSLKGSRAKIEKLPLFLKELKK